MPYISYQIDPDDPRATEEARSRAYREYSLSILLFLGTLGAIINFFYKAFSLFHAIEIGKFFISIGLLSLAAVLDFFFLFFHAEKGARIYFAKRYFLFYSGGVLIAFGIVGVIQAISSLYYSQTGVLLLVGMIILIVVTLISVWMIYRKIAERPISKIRLFTDKSIQALEATNPIKRQKQVDLNFLYCRHCGQKVPIDSIYCHNCGTKLK